MMLLKVLGSGDAARKCNGERPPTFVRVAICVSMSLLLCGPAHALPAGVGSLVWSDEFNGDELDLSKWFHRATGPRQDGYLTPEAVSVANGVLTIKTYTEGGVHYSGMIANYLFNPILGVGAVQGMNHAYGYFEVRARFHTSIGTSSAFWLQSATIGNPIGNPEVAGVEMDIFEHRVYNGHDPSTPNMVNRINQAMIWNGYGPEQQLRTQLSNTLPGLGNNSWHTFGLLWTPTTDSLPNYMFYYDGVPIWNGGGAPVSQADQYVILSSEVIEAFAGPIPAGGYGARGDYNDDGIVNAADYVTWRMSLGETVGRGSGADASTNGIVGPEDHEIWQRNFGGAASVTSVQFDYVRVYGLSGAAGGGHATSMPVPEPTCAALLFCGMLSLGIHRRR